MKEKIIKIIKEYNNPYPKDIFKWDNKEKLDINRGRFNEFTFNIVENIRNDIIKIIEENLTKHNSSFIQDCFKKIFPEYNEFPKCHRLLELQKLLEECSPK